jgi:hypothetical protein
VSSTASLPLAFGAIALAELSALLGAQVMVGRAQEQAAY